MKRLLLIILSIYLCFGCKQKQSDENNTKESIAKVLGTMPNASIQEVIAYYYKLKNEVPSIYNFEDENELNTLGYQYLNNGKVKEAIEIFKLLVSEFPEASNPYDSLGEAYLADGNKEKAVKNYEKSLALNPKNINAEDYINRIKYGDYDTSRFYKVYPNHQYLEDLNELGKRLTEVHPNVFKFISEKEFWQKLEEKKKLITEETTFSQFIWYCSEIIANINCSHTSLGYFYQERTMLPIDLRFPLEVRLIKDRLYVVNPLVNKDILKPADEIIAINGLTVNELKAKVYPNISSQGKIETYKKNFLNAHSTSIIPYAFNFPKSYTVTLKKQQKKVVLKKLSSYKSKLGVLPKYLAKKPLDLKYINDKTAVLTIRTFAYYGNKFKEFKQFTDKIFNELKDKNIQNLIIDVRKNGGGSSDAGRYLFRYLAKEPFIYYSKAQFNEKLEEVSPLENSFKENLYFMMDGNGGSTTGHFMSLIKHLKLGTLVGEELGSNQFCTGGQKRLRLPNTGIQYAVARNTYQTTATSLPIDRGVFPDVVITQGIQEYLKEQDTMLKYILEEIKLRE
ncbi:Tetratricopeptide repeat protein [Tenacibaculum sp. 190524A02b]|uniref:Tetratricopeptide repeat protein n=1 Tax=Tenacibaculum vairaonense TaxID=3137860 RepID=A0ABM9PNC6_9FLAO